MHVCFAKRQPYTYCTCKSCKPSLLSPVRTYSVKLLHFDAILPTCIPLFNKQLELNKQVVEWIASLFPYIRSFLEIAE